MHLCTLELVLQLGDVLLVLGSFLQGKLKFHAPVSKLNVGTENSEIVF